MGRDSNGLCQRDTYSSLITSHKVHTSVNSEGPITLPVLIMCHMVYVQTTQTQTQNRPFVQIAAFFFALQWAYSLTNTLSKPTLVDSANRIKIEEGSVLTIRGGVHTFDSTSQFLTQSIVLFLHLHTIECYDTYSCQTLVDSRFRESVVGLSCEHYHLHTSYLPFKISRYC